MQGFDVNNRDVIEANRWPMAPRVGEVIKELGRSAQIRSSFARDRNTRSLTAVGVKAHVLAGR